MATYIQMVLIIGVHRSSRLNFVSYTPLQKTYEMFDGSDGFGVPGGGGLATFWPFLIACNCASFAAAVCGST